MTWKRTDNNQTQIVQTLRKLGATVFIASGVGHGFPDLVVKLRDRVYLVEVKDGNRPPSQQKLTACEVEFHRQWAPCVVIINSVESAIEFVNKEANNARITMP